MLYVYTLLLGTLEVIKAQRSELCATSELMDIEGIVETCCESEPSQCADAFPATCSHTCASMLVTLAMGGKVIFLQAALLDMIIPNET